jgi:hypothetical protein
MMRQKREVTVPEPDSQLLAVIDAGTSLEDVIARLAQVQAEHPGAQVRSGRQGSWEIWTIPGKGGSA